MQFKASKILIVFLVVMIVAPGLMIPKQADALFGALDVVTDPGNTITNIAGWVQEWSRWLLDQGLAVIAATLRKRLIDNITKRTVQMIQGDGEPRFVDNYKGLLGETANEAVGQTAQELGFSNLCSSNLGIKLRFQLEEKTFRDRVSCTLDDIVENVEAFDDDFRNGSWLAYNEVLKPANNELGLRLMANNQLLENRTREEEETKSEIESGGGFLSQKRCLKWEKKVNVSDSNNNQISTGQTSVSGEDFYFNAPNDTGTTPSNVRYTGKTDRPAGTDWYCAQSETVTPGSTLRDTMSKSLETDIDFLNNASDDIAGAVSTIANAAINQLTKKGLGIIGIGAEGEGGTPIGSGSGDCSNFEGAARDACEQYSDDVSNARDEANSSASDLESRSDDVENSSRRSQVLTYDKCEAWVAENVPEFGDIRDEALEDCRENALNSGPAVETGTAHILSSGESHEHSNAWALSVSKPKQILLNYEWSWESCPEGSGQCPELTQASGDLASEEAEIPGPTYTPTENGVYKLKLTVRDTGGDKTEQILQEKTMTITAGESHNIGVGESHTHSGAYASDDAGALQSYDWEFISCPNQCPSVTKSGIFDNNNEGDIEGPTFTPSDSGDYTLQLNVRDSNGNVTSETVTDTATSTQE